MSANPSIQPLAIGVCSWSIDRRDPGGSIRAAGEAHRVDVVHLGFFDEATLAAADAAAIGACAAESNVAISAMFAAFEGEDYSSIASIAETGGYMPDDRWESRLAYTVRVAQLGTALDVPRVAMHAGTVPDPDVGGNADAAFAKLVERTRRVADALAELNQTLLLETGRESAELLVRFIDAVGRDNVGVNFDPGNFIIYGQGDPVRAVRTLGDRIRHVHLKDAVASDKPGTAFGSEATLGTGDANIPRVVSKLRAGGYVGPLIVERTAGRGDPGTLDDSIDYVRSLLL